MTPELESQLVADFPMLFANDGLPPEQSAMAFGCDHGDGWYDILRSLCERLTLLAETFNIEIAFVQVKEKFGGLRTYYTTTLHEDENDVLKGIISAIVSHTAAESFHVCELCGRSGLLRQVSDHWWQTVCFKCKPKQECEPDEAA